MSLIGSKTFRRDGASVTDSMLGDGQANYTPRISERRNGASSWLHSGLKNADGRTLADKSLEATRRYDAFGNVDSSSGSWQGPFGYAGGFGYQEDSDTGLKLLGHRYYDASIGRFISRDPIGAGRNWYSYAANNPATWADDGGLLARKLADEEYRVMDRALRVLFENGESVAAIKLQNALAAGRFMVHDDPDAVSKFEWKYAQTTPSPVRYQRSVAIGAGCQRKDERFLLGLIMMKWLASPPICSTRGTTSGAGRRCGWGDGKNTT